MLALLLVEFNLKQWVPLELLIAAQLAPEGNCPLGSSPRLNLWAAIPPRHLLTWEDSQSLHHWNILWIAYRQALPLKSPHLQVYILLITPWNGRSHKNPICLYPRRNSHLPKRMFLTEMAPAGNSNWLEGSTTLNQVQAQPGRNDYTPTPRPHFIRQTSIHN